MSPGPDLLVFQVFQQGLRFVNAKEGGPPSRRNFGKSQSSSNTSPNGPGMILAGLMSGELPLFMGIGHNVADGNQRLQQLSRNSSVSKNVADLTAEYRHAVSEFESAGFHRPQTA